MRTLNAGNKAFQKMYIYWSCGIEKKRKNIVCVKVSIQNLMYDKLSTKTKLH